MTRDNWREVAQLAALIGALTAVGFVVTAVGAALLLPAWDLGLWRRRRLVTDVAYVNAVQFIARCPACDQDAEWTSRRVEHQIRTGVTYLAVGQRVTCTVDCDCAP